MQTEIYNSRNLIGTIDTKKLKIVLVIDLQQQKSYRHYRLKWQKLLREDLQQQKSYRHYRLRTEKCLEKMDLQQQKSYRHYRPSAAASALINLQQQKSYRHYRLHNWLRYASICLVPYITNALKIFILSQSEKIKTRGSLKTQNNYFVGLQHIA